MTFSALLLIFLKWQNGGSVATQFAHRKLVFRNALTPYCPLYLNLELLHVVLLYSAHNSPASEVNFSLNILFNHYFLLGVFNFNFVKVSQPFELHESG